MTQEVLKLALEALERLRPEGFFNEAITAIKEALREHAMREVQRLGQEIEQEPVAHWSDCGVHNEPAYPAGECDCGGFNPTAWLVEDTDGPRLYFRQSFVSEHFPAFQAQPCNSFVDSRFLAAMKPMCTTIKSADLLNHLSSSCIARFR